jgi:hypothetical protein
VSVVAHFAQVVWPFFLNHMFFHLLNKYLFLILVFHLALNCTCSFFRQLSFKDHLLTFMKNEGYLLCTYLVILQIPQGIYDV